MDLEAVKEGVPCFDHHGRKRSSHSYQSPHIARRPRTCQATELSFPVPTTMRHHARSQISEVQLKLSSGRGSRGQAQTAFTAQRPKHGVFDVVGAVGV